MSRRARRPSSSKSLKPLLELSPVWHLAHWFRSRTVARERGGACSRRAGPASEAGEGTVRPRRWAELPVLVRGQGVEASPPGSWPRSGPASPQSRGPTGPGQSRRPSPGCRPRSPRRSTPGPPRPVPRTDTGCSCRSARTSLHRPLHVGLLLDVVLPRCVRGLAGRSQALACQRGCEEEDRVHWNPMAGSRRLEAGPSMTVD